MNTELFENNCTLSRHLNRKKLKSHALSQLQETETKHLAFLANNANAFLLGSVVPRRSLSILNVTGLCSVSTFKNLRTMQPMSSRQTYTFSDKSGGIPLSVVWDWNVCILAAATESRPQCGWQLQPLHSTVVVTVDKYYVSSHGVPYLILLFWKN